MPSEHREALQSARIESARALQLHRQILVGCRRRIAHQALQQERARTQRAVAQHQLDLERARIEAQEYRVVWLQAKKDGARLLQFVDRHLKKAA